jgi:hypothetical protein
MINTIRNLFGTLIAFALGLLTVRSIILSKDLESATYKDSSLRDSKERDIDKGEPSVEKYRVYSREHLEMLTKIFPHKRWSKDTTEAQLAFNAGQQSVIDSIANRLSAPGV